jgi:uncharacterized OB-fold protein
MSSPNRPLPRIGPDNEPFWEGCRRHSLMLPTCAECGKAHLPPGPVCPYCLSDRITWRRATGQGRVTSWTIVHKAWFPAFRDDIPYNVVQIELDEGPRLTSSLVGLSGREPEIGQRVEVVFDDVDDILTLHRFRVLA